MKIGNARMRDPLLRNEVSYLVRECYAPFGAMGWEELKLSVLTDAISTTASRSAKYAKQIIKELPNF